MAKHVLGLVTVGLFAIALMAPATALAAPGGATYQVPPPNGSNDLIRLVRLSM